MFVNQTESTQFIQSLKRAGVQIHNEGEVIERLAEAREWRYAFNTLVQQGKRIGIRFAASNNINADCLTNLFQRYRLSGSQEATFTAALQG